MATEPRKVSSKAAVARAVGSEDLEAGAGLLDAAADAAGESVVLTAVGSADLTRGEDQLEAASALDDLSDIAGAKGVRDAAAGAITLGAAEDAAAVGALMAAVTVDDLERGMLLASLSGQLRVAGDVVDLMRMPVLSEFLGLKGRQLRGLAVNEIGRAMAAAALAEGMNAMADRLAALGLGEVAAGSANSTRPMPCSTPATRRQPRVSDRRPWGSPSCRQPRQRPRRRDSSRAQGSSWSPRVRRRSAPPRAWRPRPKRRRAARGEPPASGRHLARSGLGHLTPNRNQP